MKPPNIRYIFIFVFLLLVTGAACGLSSLEDQATPEAIIEAEIVNSSSESSTSASSGSQQSAVVTALTNNAIAGSARQVVGSLDLQSRLIELYNMVNPSVVQILVYTSQTDSLPLGRGSGFVYDSEGRIVTNNHVVADGEVLEVVFADGTRSYAEVVGRDVDSDLAVIDAETIPTSANPVVLGDSDALLVGQLVIAIGNPFGEQGSMSLGIVSGLGRSLESQRILENNIGSYTLPEVIQTDAPINPGNSGGPLLNMDGEVIGVNSAIRTMTGVNSGVGFSIPVNAVHQIAPVLIDEGEFTYSYMGVSIQSLNLNLQDLYDLPQPVGAYVTGVTPNAPADQAGLISANRANRLGGDLIVAINDEPVLDTESLIAYLVFDTRVGETVELTVIRDGETIELPMTLGARP